MAKHRCVSVSLVSIHHILYKYTVCLYSRHHFNILDADHTSGNKKMAATRSVLVFWAVVLLCNGSASKTTQLVSVQRDDADGERLIQLGQTFNNSMLKLVGHTFENLEESFVNKLCHKTPCTLWSNWTTCTGKGPNTFGYQTRVRKCWYNSTDPCAKDGAVTIETSSKLCEGKCRSDYTITKHGFCLKFGTTVELRIDAVKICESEGGHMMNVDTKERLMDFTKIAKTPLSIFVDGTRAKAKGPFSYHSGGDPIANGVLRWSKGEPGLSVKELCLATKLVSGTMYWFDVYCDMKMAFVCEIR